MAYSIDRYNSSGTSAIIVEDGTINTTLDLKLIGKNYAGYGEAQNENFLWLLENFSSRTAPSNAIIGQLWYDSSVGKIKVNYSAGEWRTLAVNNVVEDGIPPVGLTVGDFWWNKITEQLYCRSINNTDVYIGGQLLGSSTQLKTALLDGHSIIEVIVNNETIAVFSNEEFEVANIGTNANTDIDNAAFPHIYPGLTFSGFDTNLSSPFFKVTGTATDSDRLAGKVATEYVESANAVFSGAASFAETGFTVGTGLEVTVNTNIPVIKSNIDTLEFKTTGLDQTYTVLTLIDGNICPGVDTITNVGTSDHQFDKMYADSFEGKLNNLTTNEAATPGTIAVRTTSASTYETNIVDAGSIFASHFAGVSFLSQGGDLAEKYLADTIYEAGTVVMIGGDAEVTAALANTRAIGVVSANPGHLMNVGLENGTAIALKGRVPVKVLGQVNKGDQLVATDTGLAKSLTTENPSLVFAIAIESNVNTEGNIIEALIL